jgi:hypothetical protein
MKWGGVYVLRYKGRLLKADDLAHIKQVVDREGERLGVKFIVLDENFELADGAPLYETPQFVAAVEAIVRRCLAKGG